jgi:cysteinyl-tRNA synthetase
VTIDGEKMSKSLGNSFFLKDVLRAYEGEVVRFYLIQTHYRANINFNEQDLLAAKKRLDKLYRLKKRVFDAAPSEVGAEFAEGIMEALGDDLNISVALAHIDNFITQANERLDENPKDKAQKSQAAANINLIDKLLGVGGSDPYRYFQQGVSQEQKAQIEELIERRNEARKSKNFAEADTIRAQLSAMGIALMDSAEGTKWEKVES